MGAKTFLVRAKGECRLVDFEDRPTDVSISASVGKDGVNRADDVRVIQSALNQVSPGQGGPTPSLAVDGIVGHFTQSAISRFQLKQLGWSDGRVDPDNVTIARLRERTSANGTAHSTPSFAPAAGKKKHPKVSAAPCTDPVFQAIIMDDVLDAVPDAKQWIFAAILALDQAKDLLTGLVPSFLSQAAAAKLKLVNKYFHLDKLHKPQAIAAVNRIHRLFNTMRTAIGHMPPRVQAGTAFLQPDPCCINKQNVKDALAYTFFGGFTRKNPKTGLPRMSKEDNYSGPNLREDTIFFCTSELIEFSNRENLTLILIHELAHWVGPEIDRPGRIDDHSYRHKHDFFKLSPHLALTTADIYAHFAAEAKLGHEVHVEPV